MSVRPKKPTVIFVLWIHFDGEFMDLKSFWLKNCFSAVFRPFLRLFKAKIGDFGEIVPPKFPVVGLFKFSHVRFFWDSRRISGRVFFIFPKIYVWGPYQPSENGSELKICDFLTFPPQIFRSQVCSNLVIQGFLGTPEKYTRMYFSFFWENVSEAHTSPQKMAQNPKNRKNDIFLTFSRWVGGSLLKVQLICFGYMATSGDVLGVYIVNSTKFQILPDFGWPEVWKNPK